MADKLIFCQPETLVVTASDCNKQVDIAEVTVCDALIGAEYTLRINGVIDPGSPYIVDGDGKLFTGGLTVIRTVPITTITLEFPCDDCEECDITAELPAVANPCSCAVTPLSVTLDVSAACTTGDLEYTITGGEGTYSVSILNGATEIYSDTQAVAGTYTFSDTFTNGLYKVIVTDAYGCVRQDTATATGCCEINLISVSYDCDNEEIVSTFFGDCVGAMSYTLKQGASTLDTGVYTGAAIAFPLSNGTYTFQIACDTCTAGPTSFTVGCGTPTFLLQQSCIGDNNSVIVSDFDGGTAPYEIEWWLGSGSHTIIAAAVDPTEINLGSVSGQTVHVTLKNSEGNTSIPELNLVLSPCDCFEITNAFYNCDPDTQDITLYVSVNATASTYAVDLLDAGNNLITANIYTGTLNGGFTLVFGPDTLSNGIYHLRVRNTTNNCTVISDGFEVSDCITYEAQYDCETGLVVDGLDSGTYTITQGANVYGPYAFDFSPLLVDGGTYIVKNAVTGEILDTFSVDCCNFSIDHTIVCDMDQDPNERATVTVTTSGSNDPADSYNVEVYISGGALVGTGSITGDDVTTIAGLPENTTLDIYVHNSTYELRDYVNGEGGTDCVQTIQDIEAVCAEASCSSVSNGMTLAPDSCTDGDVLFLLSASDTGVVVTGVQSTYFRTPACSGGSLVVNHVVGTVVNQTGPVDWEITIPVSDNINGCCLCLFYMRLIVTFTFEGLTCTKTYISSGEGGSEEICDTFGECISGVDPEEICNF